MYGVPALALCSEPNLRVCSETVLYDLTGGNGGGEIPGEKNLLWPSINLNERLYGQLL